MTTCQCNVSCEQLRQTARKIVERVAPAIFSHKHYHIPGTSLCDWRPATKATGYKHNSENPLAVLFHSIALLDCLLVVPTMIIRLLVLH